MGRDYACNKGFDGCEFGAFIAIIILLFIIFGGFGLSVVEQKNK